MTIILQETFETDGNGTRYMVVPGAFTDGSGDFFTRTDGSTVGSFYQPGTPQGSFYFAAMDTDGEPEGGATVSVEFNGIDIAGKTDLRFSGLFAEDDDGSNQDWDADSLVFVEVQIDGGGYQKILQFASQGATNTEPGLDTDFDGVADGPSLTDSFTSFAAAIAGTGTTLDLRITAENLDAGDEDIAFDNITIEGTSAEVTVLDESFDDTSKFTTSAPFFSDGSFDYFGIADGNGDGGADFGTGATPTGLKAFTGTTDNYLTGMDLNGEGASLPVTVTWAGLDIAGLTDLKFAGDFGEFFDDPGDIDADDFIRIKASIDGGAEETILEFRGADFSSTGGPFNGVFRQDTDFDGTGDGTALGNALQTFSADIAGTGSTLDLTLELRVEAGDEDFAADNFKIVGMGGGTVDPAVILSAGDGLQVNEEGETTDTFSLALATVPESPVTVTISAPDGQSLISGDGVAFADTLEVTLSDTTPFEVTVAAVDDDVDEADPHTGNLTFAVTSDDTDYDGLAVTDLSVTIGDDDVSITKIHEIQGTGDASPLLGNEVTVEAIVTGVITRADGSIEGYFLQEEDADADAARSTSEGIYVFARFDSVDVQVGDKVRATGEVAEFGGLTQLGSGTLVETLETGVTLPTAVQITLSQRDNFEALEAMRVELVAEEGADPLTVVTNFNLDRFGEVQVAEGNLTQPTQLFDAQTQAPEVAALAEANELGRITIDDFSTAQNPDVYRLVDSGDGTPLTAGDPITADGPTLRLGAEVTSITGVLDERFGRVAIQADDPLDTVAGTNADARPDVAPEVGGDLKIASFNVLNYFTSLSDSSATNPAGQARGARTESDLGRQTEKLVLALTEIDADIIGLQEIENNGFGEGSAIDALVDALNAATAPGTYAYVDPGVDFVGTDAITTGLIYKTDAVSVKGSAINVFEESSAATTFAKADALQQQLLDLGVYNLEDGSSQNDPPVGDFQRNRPAVAATFEDAEGNEITVVSNHFKSKGPSGLSDLVEDAEANGLDPVLIADLVADPNYDQNDGQAFWNQVREDAAGETTDWLASNPTGAEDTENQLILGDLNAYAKEDPVQAIEEDGFTDLAEAFIGEDAYSFVFDGQRGTLDYGLASEGLVDNITGVAEWHIAADEPDLLSYNSRFTDPAFYNADFYASSDHDPLIIGIEFEDAVETVETRLEFIDRRSGRDRVEVSVDGEVVDVERLQRLSEEIEIEATDVTIGADDGLRFSPEFLTTQGKGLGIWSLFGDRWFSNDRREIDGREEISFMLGDETGLGDALDVEFEFGRVSGRGRVELSFYDDGELVDSVRLQVEDKAVAYDLEGDMTFDEVRLGVTRNLDVTISAVEFLRQDDGFEFM